MKSMIGIKEIIVFTASYADNATWWVKCGSHCMVPATIAAMKFDKNNYTYISHHNISDIYEHCAR